MVRLSGFFHSVLYFRSSSILQPESANTSFLFKAEPHHHILFIHSSANGPLGCFHFRAISSKVVVNVDEQVSAWTSVFTTPRHLLRRGTDRSDGALCLAF